MNLLRDGLDGCYGAVDDELDPFGTMRKFDTIGTQLTSQQLEFIHPSLFIRGARSGVMLGEQPAKGKPKNEGGNDGEIEELHGVCSILIIGHSFPFMSYQRI